MLDYHLLFRTVSENQIVSSWQRVGTSQDMRKFHSLIWNPKKKHFKTLIDIVTDLLKVDQKLVENRGICVSLPYLHILNYLDSLPHAGDTQKVQFMVLGNSKIWSNEVLFVSDTHVLSSYCSDEESLGKEHMVGV